VSYNEWWDAENVSLGETEYNLAKSAWNSAFFSGYDNGVAESKDDIKFWNDAFLEQRESADNYIKEMRLEFGAMVHERDEQIKVLREALEDANWMCRSAYSIVNAEFLNRDWPAFRVRLGESLKRQYRVMYPQTYGDGMTEENDKSFLRQQQDELRRADFEEEMRLDAFGSKHE